LIASSIYAAAAEVIGRLSRMRVTPRSIAQPKHIRSVRVPPASMAFTVLLGFLVALPSFGIDMSLPALTAMGAALRVAPAQAGLMMSLFMLACE
jgi:hypothetical protein